MIKKFFEFQTITPKEDEGKIIWWGVEELFDASVGSRDGGRCMAESGVQGEEENGDWRKLLYSIHIWCWFDDLSCLAQFRVVLNLKHTVIAFAFVISPADMIGIVLTMTFAISAKLIRVASLTCLLHDAILFVFRFNAQTGAHNCENPCNQQFHPNNYICIDLCKYLNAKSDKIWNFIYYMQFALSILAAEETRDFVSSCLAE